MTKICNTCGKEADDGANFCVHCKGRSFRPKYEVTAPNNDIVHRMFYWPYSNGATLSKSKIAGIGVGAYLLISWIVTGTNPIVALVLAVIFGLATFLIGFLIHKILPQPPLDKIKHNDYGLKDDLKHLFFYWQDRHGGYILSKTKILSFAVFLLMFGVGLFTLKTPVVMAAIIFGLVFEIPAFLVGFGIHKITYKDTSGHVIPEKKEKPKIETPKSIPRKPQIISEYMDYQFELDDLNSKFKSKEKSTRRLIEKRFEPPQLTYTRFITGVDKSKELFEKNLNSALTMINLADEYSPRIAGEIEAKMEILKAIIKKLDDLSNELILNDDLSKEGDVDSLIDDMDNLINSVKDYE